MGEIVNEGVKHHCMYHPIIGLLLVFVLVCVFGDASGLGLNLP